MFVKVVIILNLLFIWNASAFFDNTDIKNKKITYIYHPQPHQKVRLVVGVTEDVFDYYIKKLMTSKDPIADYEEFLSSRCAVSKPKDDIYTVFKLALRVLVEDKNTDPKLYRFLLGRSEALRGYPLTKNWTQKRQGGDPDG